MRPELLIYSSFSQVMDCSVVTSVKLFPETLRLCRFVRPTSGEISDILLLEISR